MSLKAQRILSEKNKENSQPIPADLSLCSSLRHRGAGGGLLPGTPLFGRDESSSHRLVCPGMLIGPSIEMI